MKLVKIKKIRHVVVAGLISACPLMGQVPKKAVTTADYPLWGTLAGTALSPNGRFASYSMEYKQGPDTLFVKAVDNGRTFTFAGGREGHFVGEQHFACIVNDSILIIQDLKKGTRSTVKGISEYQVGNGTTLLLFGRDDGNGSLLNVLRPNGTVLKTRSGITSWNFNPQAASLLYCSLGKENTVGIIKLDNGLTEETLMHSDSLQFLNPVWHGAGKAVAFVGRPKGKAEGTGDRLYYRAMDDRQLHCLDPTLHPGWPKGHILASLFRDNLVIAGDGRRVFFYTRDHSTDSTTGQIPAVRVWNTADKFLQAHTERYGSYQSWPRLAMWTPGSDKFQNIATPTEQNAQLNGTQSHAITFNPIDNAPGSKQQPDRDCYITDLSTGKKGLFLKNLPDYNALYMSPDGKHIAYFLGQDWWVYSIPENQHRNLTKNIATHFADASESRPGDIPPYGFAGWIYGKEGVLLYDRFDVWQVAADGAAAAQLTNGKEYNRVYRFNRWEFSQGQGFSGSAPVIDTARKLLLEARDIDYQASGFFSWHNNKLQEIVYGSFHAAALIKASNKETYGYTVENYDRPPALHIKKDNKEERVIVQGNPQQNRFLWGRSELVSYTDRHGEKLKGILFYPAGYDPGKQYPMVVHIYERQLAQQHRYTNPSLLNASGFNKTNFTTSGYFVLYPDIAYTIWEPGISALDCVTAAVYAAEQNASIDEGRIGLIGHSFGGYETNFIITQTDIFHAAVSGNGVSDLSSSYLSVGWSYALPNYWRFEHDQCRMGYIFNNWEHYDRNSAVRFADKVTTPLLSWIGENDDQVNPFQSYEFHISLRRLGKRGLLITYPGEGHVIIDPYKQKDLSIKVMEWCDHYLKDKPEPEWCKPN